MLLKTASKKLFLCLEPELPGARVAWTQSFPEPELPGPKVGSGTLDFRSRNCPKKWWPHNLQFEVQSLYLNALL